MTDVLLVAYHYPPISSAGTQRAVSFLKHLPQHGYRVHVLTTNAFGQESPDTAYRASELVGGYRAIFNPAARDLLPHIRSRTRTGSARSLLSRLGRRLLIPDAQVGWLPSAYRVARHILNSQPIGVVLTTGPPFSSHLLGLALRKTENLPWVADFRDTWTHDPLDESITSPLRSSVESWMERLVLEGATRVTCVTDIAAGVLGTHTQKPVSVIPNGYEARSPATGARREKSGPVRFVHTGSFSTSHPRRSPESLVRAAQMLGDEVDFELVFVGPLDENEIAMIQPLVDSGRAIVTGAVSSDEALGWQDRADVLVVVDHPRDVLASNVPGKVYEYGASGKPILAIVPPGATDRLITEMEAGICVRHDPKEIAVAITAMANGTSGLSPDKRKWQQFDRGKSAEKMARVLSEVMEN